MATLSSLSLIIPSVSPKTLALSTPKFTPFAISTSHSLSAKPLSASPSFLSVPSQTLSFRFASQVTVWSELDEEEEEEVLSDGRERSSSHDLQLFVGNLSFNVDSSQLAGLFETAGNVEMVEVIYDKVTGRNRGFAFFTMSTIEEAEAATQQFNGYELDGRPIRVNLGPPPQREAPPPRMGRGGSSSGPSGSGNRVYVGNLSWGVDDLALESLFREQGKVVEAKVVYVRESGRSRGFGFVTYNSAKEIDRAIESLNGADLNGRAIRVTVAESKPRRQF